MISDIDILTKASALAQHAERRHAVIAENIAHADTPGYRARELPDFDAETARRLRDAGEFEISQMMQPVEIESAPASPNGNTVSLDQQMVAAADAQAQHQTALAFYKKAMDLLRLSFSTSR